MKEIIMIASVNPVAIPALTIAGIAFVIVNLLGFVYMFRKRRQLFGPDPSVDGDKFATRSLGVIALTIPLLFITIRLITELVEMWTQ